MFVTFNDATTAPVVGMIVNELSELETDDTAPEEPEEAAVILPFASTVIDAFA